MPVCIYPQLPLKQGLISIFEELDMIKGDADGTVIYPVETPLTPTGGVVGLKGNLAPDGAIVKVAGMTEEEQSFTGPARVFESEEEAFEAVKARGYEEGEVIVIRNEGPSGGPGMREMLATTAALSGQGMGTLRSDWFAGKWRCHHDQCYHWRIVSRFER